MKILILLSLAAISLAKRQNGRSAFQYPGQPSSGISNSFSLNEFADFGPLISGKDQKHSDKQSSEVELRNPNRRDLKIGNFPARGFSGPPKGNEKKEPDIVLSALSKSPLIKNADPLFTKNTIPVLEKEKSSSSESNGRDNEESASSSSGQSSESAEAINQQESSSSEAAPTEKQEESSSSEETKAPEVNQEEPIEAVTSADSGSAQNTPEEDAEPSLEPFVLSKFIKFANRKQGFHSKHRGPFQQPSPIKGNVPGSRPIRGLEANYSDIRLGSPRNQILEPQGQTKGTRRGRRPFKK